MPINVFVWRVYESRFFVHNNGSRHGFLDNGYLPEEYVQCIFGLFNCFLGTFRSIDFQRYQNNRCPMSGTFSEKNVVAPATQIHSNIALPRWIDGINGLFRGMLLRSGCPSVFPHCSVLNSTIVYKGNSTGRETWFGNKQSHRIIDGSQSRWMWDNFRCI